jgi:hypothetical protein
MHRLSIKEADNFLNEHFKLFIEKKLEEGFNYRIELTSDKINHEPDCFYVKFWNDNECPKNYKIICRK